MDLTEHVKGSALALLRTFVQHADSLFDVWLNTMSMQKTQGLNTALLSFRYLTQAAHELLRAKSSRFL